MLPPKITSLIAACLLMVLSCPTVATAACPGDCKGDDAVTVDDLITGINIALGDTPVRACQAFDVGADQVVTVDELLAAIDAALFGCPGNTPPLKSSDPSAGAASVPRTAWIRLDFNDAVDQSALRGFTLECDGVVHPVTVSSISPDIVVVNPVGELPSAATCSLSWSGPEAPQSLSFSTAAPIVGSNPP